MYLLLRFIVYLVIHITGFKFKRVSGFLSYAQFTSLDELKTSIVKKTLEGEL